MTGSTDNRIGGRRLAPYCAIAVGLVIGVIAGSIGIAAGSDKPAAPAGPATTTWPQNSKGMTYGSGLDAQSSQDEPDLIQVLATNGRIGYALRSDLEGPTPETPQQALLQQAARDERSRLIPVYESDGVTQVGVFMIGYARNNQDTSPPTE